MSIACAVANCGVSNRAVLNVAASGVGLCSCEAAAPVIEPLFSDDFDRVLSGGNLGTAPNGNNYEICNQGGWGDAWTANGTVAYKTGANGTYQGQVVDMGRADGTLKVVFSKSGEANGIAFRRGDEAVPTWFFAYVTSSGSGAGYRTFGIRYLTGTSSGSLIAVANNVNVNAGGGGNQPADLKLVLAANAMHLIFVNSAGEEYSAINTSSTSNQTKTKHGIAGLNTTGTYTTYGGQKRGDFDKLELYE